MFMCDLVKSPFISLTAIAPVCPDVRLEHERTVVSKLLKTASFSRVSRVGQDDKRGGNEENVRENAGTSRHTALTMRVHSTSDGEQIYTLMLESITKRFYLYKNLAVFGVENLTIRMKSSMFFFTHEEQYVFSTQEKQYIFSTHEKHYVFSTHEK